MSLTVVLAAFRCSLVRIPEAANFTEMNGFLQITDC